MHELKEEEYIKPYVEEGNTCTFVLPEGTKVSILKDKMTSHSFFLAYYEEGKDSLSGFLSFDFIDGKLRGFDSRMKPKKVTDDNFPWLLDLNNMGALFTLLDRYYEHKDIPGYMYGQWNKFLYISYYELAGAVYPPGLLKEWCSFMEKYHKMELLVKTSLNKGIIRIMFQRFITEYVTSDEHDCRMFPKYLTYNPKASKPEEVIGIPKEELNAVISTDSLAVLETLLNIRNQADNYQEEIKNFIDFVNYVEVRKKNIFITPDLVSVWAVLPDVYEAHLRFSNPGFAGKSIGVTSSSLVIGTTLASQGLTVKKFISYLINNQVTADLYNYYQDYIDMSASNSGVDLFPKDIKKAHDQVMTQKELEESELIREHFLDHYPLWKKLENVEVENSEFCMVAPTKYEDLVKESSSMNNCVAHYGKRVAGGDHTHILFLRNKNSKDDSLVTVEIEAECNAYTEYTDAPVTLMDSDTLDMTTARWRPWNSQKPKTIYTVVQAKEKHNKPITDEHFSFLEDWVDKINYLLIEKSVDKDPDILFSRVSRTRL